MSVLILHFFLVRANKRLIIERYKRANGQSKNVTSILRELNYET